jgi:hypothetical protein
VFRGPVGAAHPGVAVEPGSGVGAMACRAMVGSWSIPTLLVFAGNGGSASRAGRGESAPPVGTADTEDGLVNRTGAKRWVGKAAVCRSFSQLSRPGAGSGRFRIGRPRRAGLVRPAPLGVRRIEFLPSWGVENANLSVRAASPGTRRCARSNGLRPSPLVGPPVLTATVRRMVRPSTSAVDPEAYGPPSPPRAPSELSERAHFLQDS